MPTWGSKDKSANHLRVTSVVKCRDHLGVQQTCLQHHVGRIPRIDRCVQKSKQPKDHTQPKPFQHENMGLKVKKVHSGFIWFEPMDDGLG